MELSRVTHIHIGEGNFEFFSFVVGFPWELVSGRGVIQEMSTLT
jgi:hypothetical protein